MKKKRKEKQSNARGESLKAWRENINQRIN